ncbi:MAG: hypothetical protein JWN40_3654 [Phycisphaerales bacterium]|nr:hypothetical protein [Phycisphaerales bacterium]
MCRHRCRRLPLALVLVPLLANLPAYAADVKQGTEPTKFLRFVEEGRDGGRLETGVVTYKNDKGVTVQLVGAVHIADPGYYEALNKQFEGYDALLYEMVKPKDMGAPGRDREQANGISLVHILQKGMKTFLDLDYQLDGIDYTKKNFVHADLTAEEFNRMQDERGESIFGLMLQQMIKELMKGDNGRAQEMDPMQLLAALSSEDSARQLKLILAKQFENMDEMVAGLEGPNGSVLVTERNKAALKVLKDTMAAGKKNIGIFYGAAHMKDMEKRMTEEMGFKRTGVEYRVAWDLSPRGAAKGAAGNGAGGRGGQIDDRDELIKKLMDKIDHLEKRLDDAEKKK